MRLPRDDIYREQATEMIAKHLEKVSREDDAERAEFPSLNRIPCGEQNYVGWMHSARILYDKLNVHVMKVNNEN